MSNTWFSFCCIYIILKPFFSFIFSLKFSHLELIHKILEVKEDALSFHMQITCFKLSIPLIKTTIEIRSRCWIEAQMRLSHSQSEIQSHYVKLPIVSFTSVAWRSSESSISSPTQCRKASSKKEKQHCQNRLKEQRTTGWLLPALTACVTSITINSQIRFCISKSQKRRNLQSTLKRNAQLLIVIPLNIRKKCGSPSEIRKKLSFKCSFIRFFGG